MFSFLKNDENKKNNIKTVIFIIIFLLFLFNFSFFVGKNSVDFPFWDQWGLVEKISQKNTFSETLLFQHNEHRFGVPLAIMEILAKLTNWSQLWEIRFISLLIISSALITLFIKNNLSKKLELSDLLIPLLFFNIFQFENIAWGFQIGFALPLFYIALWLLAIRIKFDKKRNLILTSISLASAYSIFHGLIIPVITIFFLIFDYLILSLTKNKKVIVMAALANILIIASIFINYQKNFQTVPSYSINLQTIKYFSLAVSNGFLFSYENFFWNILLTLTALSFFLKGIFQTLKQKNISGSLIGIFLIFYSLIFISIITFGRSTFGTAQALSSRYVTYAMLIPVGIIFILSDSNKKSFSIIKVVLFLFVLFNSFYFVGPTLQYVQGMTEGKQKALACYKNSPLSEYKNCFDVFAFYPKEEFITPLISEVIKIKKMQPSIAPRILEKFIDVSTQPQGREIPVSVNKIIEKSQNLKIEGNNFIPENSDPNFTIKKEENLKGFSWKSNIQGKTKLYFVPEGEGDYSESNSVIIEGKNGYFAVNLENTEEALRKKIKFVRIDPTDKIEEFQMDDFKIYQ